MSYRVTVIVPVWNQEELVVRALDSIPRREDIEVIAVDDGSTDNTLSVLRKYKKEHQDLNMTVLFSKENHGVAHATNKALLRIKTEYYNVLGSDDFLYTEEYEKAMDQIDGSDIVCFNLRTNDGTVFNLNDDTKIGLCGQSMRFYRVAFAGGLQLDEQYRVGADYNYNLALLKKNPRHKFTGIVAYHYNYPREGSNYNLLVTGKLCSPTSSISTP